MKVGSLSSLNCFGFIKVSVLLYFESSKKRLDFAGGPLISPSLFN